MSKEDNGEKTFLNDVAKHEMTVVRDDGLHRHIRFKKPGSYSMYFDLITWPGHLCYTGDMGTYVFSRLDDMFEFFRTDREYMRLGEGKTLAINPGYWGEKLQAVDRVDGFKKYSHEKFCRLVNELVDQYIADEEMDADKAQELRDEIKSGVLGCDESEDCAHMAARDFEHEGFEFRDFWEYDLKDYSFRFLWCCYALAWGIKKYDEAKAACKETA